MFAVRLGVVFLALLACTQAREKCVTRSKGKVTTNYIDLPTVSTTTKNFKVQIPRNVPHCEKVVGVTVTVCTPKDYVRPRVVVQSLRVAAVHRYGRHGNAVILVRVFCNKFDTEVGTLGASLGAAVEVEELHD